MRISTLIAVFLWTIAGLAHAQCDLSTLQPINSPSQVLTADMECTDADGWTHYYNSSSSNRILLSIKKNGQNIGAISQGLTITAGTLPSFGTGAFNLSGADYIDMEIWVVANRYWQVTGANPIANPVQIRFYFSNDDVADIAQTVDDFGFLVDEPKDLYMFTLGKGSGLYPLATSTQPSGAEYVLYDMFPGGAPEWSAGDFNGFPYGEFTASTLDIGGGAGFLIFQNAPLLAIEGKITRPNGTPVPDVLVQAASISSDVTDAQGNYSSGSLLSGSDYEVVPSKDINYAEGISLVDLVAMTRHINGSQPITDPYRLIAANANGLDNLITFTDLQAIRDLLFGATTDFPNSASWRFVPKSYVFPNPTDPFNPLFPESISVPNLQDTLMGQDFYGVKIGDVADPSTAAPPALDTKFSLNDLNACNPGDTISFSLTVEDFQNIRGFQFTLSWNPSVMHFVSASNFNLLGLTNNSFGQAAAAAGKLGVIWVYSQTAAGATLADGTVICQLKFVATGPVGSSTPLSFTTAPTDMQLVHQNMTQVVPLGDAGSFIIDNNTTIAASAFVQTASCMGPATGAIDLTATGGSGSLSYHWSNGALTQDIFGLVANTYTVTITDASGACPLVQSYQVTAPPPMALTADVSDVSCAYLVDGSIALQVGGGEAPFSYVWSNGKTTRNLHNLLAGNYTVTVTDGAGCTSTASFTIGAPAPIMPVVMVTNASNANKSDGAVEISAINGGTGPFTFHWNTGATTQNLVNVPPGDYIVTITDTGTGCQHVFGYEVYGLFTGTVDSHSDLASVAAYPNPLWAGDAIHLQFTMKNAGKLMATVLAADGKMVSNAQYSLPSGSSFQQLAAPAVAGFYFVRLEMEGRPVGYLKLVVR
jgi:hypothetical protein